MRVFIMNALVRTFSSSDKQQSQTYREYGCTQNWDGQVRKDVRNDASSERGGCLIERIVNSDCLKQNGGTHVGETYQEDMQLEKGETQHLKTAKTGTRT